MQIRDEFARKNDSLSEAIMGQVVLLLSLLKILFFLRKFENFGALVQMLLTTMTGLVNFMAFLFLSILFFAISISMLNATFSDSDYPGLNSFIVILI